MTMRSNKAIVNAAGQTITTAGLAAGGALNPEKAKKYAEIFYNQAQLIAGLPIDDPSAYTDLLCSLWQ